MPDYPRGTVAFLFTDIEGSTQRWESRPAAMAAAVERHFALLREAIEAEQGVLFKTVGDAVQAAFPTVPQAVAAAVAAQTALRAEDWGELDPLRVRLAIHAGAATPHDGDYLAPSLNRLARVLGVGYGEQILLTHAARTLATSLPPGYALRDLGPHRLRDLLEAEPVFQLTGPGLPASFPPLKSLDLHPNNLPAQPTALVGREGELAALRGLLTAPETRLVTLLGPGGTGKTRLALQVAAEVLDAFPDGVWWAPLAAIADPGLVLQAIAAVFGVREGPGEPLGKTLAAHLGQRKTLLLLDNVEHLIAAAPEIDGLLRAAPGLVVLATSREPLRLRAEREFPVAPLPLPRRGAKPTPEEALVFPAIRLFVDRAQAVKPGFTLDAANVSDVVAVCRRLDGLPLAIELAAARVRLLPPATLLARLDRRLAILTGGARDLPARQQTLRNTIAWSYDLLEPAERGLFARLAVFAGGFSLEAAEAVCSSAGGLPLDLLDGIDSLLQKSLLRQEDGPGGDARFTMLQTIREFAQERLGELPEVEELRRAHADAFLDLAERANWDDFSEQAALLDRLDADHANLRQAIGYYEQQGEAGLAKRVRLVAALTDFWWLRGHLSEGRTLLESAIASRGEASSVDCAAAVSGAAAIAEAQGDLDRAHELHEEALALFREAGNARGIARTLWGLGVIARQRGNLDTARCRHQEALEAWRNAGDEAGTAGALLDLGLIHQLAGDYGEAERLVQEGLALFRRLQDHAGEAHALHYLGILALYTGDLEAAIDWFGQSLRLWETLGIRQMVDTDLSNLGEAHHLSGSLDEAERLYRDALARFAELGDLRGRSSVLLQLGLLALDRGDPARARESLLESLRLRWDAGLRGAAAETLDALAEAFLQLGDPDRAAGILRAGERLRAETGMARQPVYEERYQRVARSLAAAAAAEPPDVDAVVASLIAASPMTRSLNGVR